MCLVVWGVVVVWCVVVVCGVVWWSFGVMVVVVVWWCCGGWLCGGGVVLVWLVLVWCLALWVCCWWCGALTLGVGWGAVEGGGRGCGVVGGPPQCSTVGLLPLLHREREPSMLWLHCACSMLCAHDIPAVMSS